MFFGTTDDYVSPGLNALRWLEDKTLTPEAQKAIENINGFFSIDWGGMISQLLLTIAFGYCVYFAVSAVGQKTIGQMVLLITFVSCVSLVVHTITG